MKLIVAVALAIVQNLAQVEAHSARSPSFAGAALAAGPNTGRLSSKLRASPKPQLRLSLADSFSPVERLDSDKVSVVRNTGKQVLLALLSRVPSNQSTPRELTRKILDAARDLEGECPTSDANVLSKLAGNWELIWTAQDLSSLPNTNPFATFINPLENQSYSNNPLGRSNPILPKNLQDTLEDFGVLSERGEGENVIKSTQAINLKRNTIRNVVAFEANNRTPLPLFSKNGKTRVTITVDVRGRPNPDDPRRVDVKFDRCRFAIMNSPIDVTFPLGVIGPTGWLRTVYVDDDLRITRGHKGSVFVLSRTSK